jgi:hypothetical protein
VELVDGPEIARRLGVTPDAVRQWRRRGLLPEPRASFGSRPVWSWAAVRRWAITTGRLNPKPDPDDKKD